MSAREDFAEWTDRFGLVSEFKNPLTTSGNAVLFTSEAAIVRHLRGEFMFSDWETFVAAIDHCEIVHGLYHRGPTFFKDQIGPDDYVGLAAASYMLGTAHAEWILEYGKLSRFKWGPFRFRYFYPTEKPAFENDIRAWFGRQPQLVAHFQWAAGETPAFWRRLYSALVIATVGWIPERGTNPYDKWKLSYLTLLTQDRRCWMGNIAAKVWKRRLLKRFKGGMKEVYKNYFGFDHPIAWYAP